MWKNYLKVAYRNLFRSRISSFVNIAGLAVGMAVAILIGLWIWDELTYNKSHENYYRIASVLQNQTFGGEVQTWWSQAMQLAPELRDKYGHNFEYVVLSSWKQDRTLRYEEKTLEKRGLFMEPEAPDMLTLHMLKGTRDGLTDPYSILLSESAAEAFFGGEDPIGKALRLDDKTEVRVTGVYEDLPQNSHFADVAFFASWELYARDLPEWIGWGNSWFQVMVQIADQADMAQVSANIKDAKLKAVMAAGNDDDRFKPELFLHPMSKWHLYSDFRNGVNVGGRIQYVWMFGIIGVFVVLLACINFMNLSTARSEKRAKEVGIRKVMGSSRRQLIGQFYSESLFAALLAFGVSVVLVQLMLPFFNEVAGKEMSILWSNPLFWLAGLGFSLFTGWIAGSYPAWYLSSFRPVNALKGTFRVGRFAAVPRKVLVVVQFTVSVVLIIGTLIIYRQIQFAKDRSIGYQQNRLVQIPIKDQTVNAHYDAFRNDLLQSGAVEEVALAESPITQTGITNSGFDWEGKDPGLEDQFWTLRISHEFGKTIGWQIKEGRDFSRDFPTDTLGFVINEAAVEYLGFEDPIAQAIKWGENGTYRIIGVVGNMITQSPYAPVRQMIFFIDYNRSNNAIVKIDPNQGLGEALGTIETIYKKYDPIHPVEYEFVDQGYAKKFGEEERIGRLAGFFALLAIFISCLGLFGMISFVAEQRTKEIGIRKVLGATVANIVSLLSKEFLKLVCIALLMATPLAWYFMNRWLENFAYRVDIQWWVFALAGVLAISIAMLTVSFQSVKAALANPVDALRDE
jgi:putative ABC transport system permease protein